jgi:ubiquinone/menaquinone biosynthesis C-methylase UbiE
MDPVTRRGPSAPPANAPQPGPLGNPAVWDAIAGDYLKDVTPFFASYGKAALKLVSLDSSSRVLDLASGPGTLTFLLAKQALSVTAVDFAPRMIDEVRARAAREGATNVDAQVMDAQSLGFPDSTFDAAFCLFAFMFFPDRARAFREIRRVLRDGGKAVIATWAPIERRPLIKLGFDAMAEVLPELPAMQKGDLQQPEACIEEMTAAGFRDVTTQSFTSSMRIESAEHFMLTMERSGAGFAMLKKRIGEQAWPGVHKRLLEAVARRIPEGGVELSAEAILSVGTR